MRPEGLSKVPCAVAVLVASIVSSPHDGAAQETCPDGRITSLFIDNHSIFDPDDLAEDQPFRWAYRLANFVHVRTRRSFLRNELLFQEGDCYDEALLEESERLIRLNQFISTADVFGVRQADGSWHVVIDTKDEWTTKLDVRVALEDGLEFRGADLTEENLLGTGVLARGFFIERDARRDVGGQLFTPRLAGTRLDASATAGATRIGSFVTEELYYPFVGEIGRIAWRQGFQRRTELFAYSLGAPERDAGEPTHVLLPFDEQRVELTVAFRRGTPGDLTTFGFGVGYEEMDFPDYPGQVELAVDRDFDNRETAPPELSAEVGDHTLHTSPPRVNLLLGQRNVRYVQRRGLDALSGIQDVEVGTDVGITLGRGLSWFDSGKADDLYGRFRFYGATTPGSLVFVSAVAFEGRRIFARGLEGQGWRDLLGEFDALLYWQPESLQAHTFFARLEGAGGWRMRQPYQLTLGGGAGVRGFHRDDFPGGRRLIASIEDRIYARWPWPELVDLGFTLFADVGRIWAGDAPFGVNSGWQGSFGGGLRFGFPAGTRGVVRLDVAVPVGPGYGLGDAFLRVSLADVVGLGGGFRDEQLERSRRTTVGPDLFTARR